MRILLTGGSGLVGRNLLEHPGQAGYQVLAPRSSELDLRDFGAVRNYLIRHQPEMVIHAAGKVGGIQANIKEPVRFLLDNLDMGRNIVMAAFEAGVKRLINLGSSCMYPRGSDEPLREEMVLRGELEPTNEGYALAKVMTTRLCEYIGREHADVQYKTIIPCNVYGRYDSFDPARSHLVPAVIHKLHQARQSGADLVTIWGDGTARREFMYAGDLADCLVEAITRFDSLPSVMNVGPGVDYTINEYYQAAARVIRYTGRFEYDLTKPVGMRRKLVSIDRLRTWGWQARTGLQEGIELTYRHYLESQSS